MKLCPIALSHKCVHTMAQDPRVAQLHVDRWLGGKAEFLKA